MIDEFTADPRGETLRPEADLHAFARWRKIESAILRGDGRAVIDHRRCLVGDPWLIEIVSYRVVDPLAVLVRAETVATDRRLGRDRSIAILDEQIQIEPPVSQSIQRYDGRRPKNRAVGHDALGEFVSPVNGRRPSEYRGSEAAPAEKDEKTHRPNENKISHRWLDPDWLGMDVF